MFGIRLGAKLFKLFLSNSHVGFELLNKIPAR